MIGGLPKQVKPFPGRHFALERVCYHPGFAAFMKLIDVTVPLDASLPIYPGNTPFTMEAVKRIARGDSSNVSTIHMSAHSGTHVDAPRHYYDDAPGVDALPLELMLGRGAIIIECLSLRDVEPGIYDMLCLPLRLVGADGAPARVLLRST